MLIYVIKWIGYGYRLTQRINFTSIKNKFINSINSFDTNFVFGSESGQTSFVKYFFKPKLSMRITW